jgi:hypothetical protein
MIRDQVWLPEQAQRARWSTGTIGTRVKRKGLHRQVGVERAVIRGQPDPRQATADLRLR